MAAWSDVRREAPELAATVETVFGANLHHVLGTRRADGSPRLSGTEVPIDAEHVRVGMMAGSRKLADVERDPRVEIHSAPLDADLRVGDARLRGRLRSDGPAEGADGTMFVLDVAAVHLVRVDGEELVMTTWTPGRGMRETRRR